MHFNGLWWLKINFLVRAECVHQRCGHYTWHYFPLFFSELFAFLPKGVLELCMGSNDRIPLTRKYSPLWIWNLRYWGNVRLQTHAQGIVFTDFGVRTLIFPYMDISNQKTCVLKWIHFGTLLTECVIFKVLHFKTYSEYFQTLTL
jgi:hypothetical protein